MRRSARKSTVSSTSAMVGRIDDDALAGVGPQRGHQRLAMRLLVALMRHVAQVGAVEAGDIFVRIAKLKLLEDVVPHALRGAGGEGGDGLTGKVLPQGGELAVFGAKFVAPFGNAVRLVDGEERQRHAAQPGDGIVARQAFRRKVEQAVLALHRRAHHIALVVGRERAVEQRRRDAHIAELRHLILHERDQRRDHDDGLAQRDRRQLVAERFAAAGRHDDGRIGAGHQALHDALLHGAK